MLKSIIILEKRMIKDPKILLRIVITLFFVIQALGGVIVKSFYDRFVALEHENALYDDRLDQLDTKIQILEMNLYTLIEVQKISIGVMGK